MSRKALRTASVLAALAFAVSSCSSGALPDPEELFGEWVRADGQVFVFSPDGTGRQSGPDGQSTGYFWEISDGYLKLFYTLELTVSWPGPLEMLLSGEDGEEYFFIYRSGTDPRALPGSWILVAREESDDEDPESVVWTFYEDGSGVMDYQLSGAVLFEWSASAGAVSVTELTGELFCLTRSEAGFGIAAASPQVFTRVSGLDSSVRGVWESGDTLLTLNADGTGDFDSQTYFTWFSDKKTLTFSVADYTTVFLLEHDSESMSLSGPVLDLTRKAQ